MAIRTYLLSGRAIDAIHAQLASSMNRDMGAQGLRIDNNAITEDFDATALARLVEERASASPEHDACWVAALYAVLLARNRVYKSTNVGTALVTMCVTLSRAGLRLEVDEREMFAAMQAVSNAEFDHEKLAEWLRRRCVHKKHAPT
jgi:prophage maintenance system killer protein